MQVEGAHISKLAFNARDPRAVPMIEAATGGSVRTMHSNNVAIVVWRRGASGGKH